MVGSEGTGEWWFGRFEEKGTGAELQPSEPWSTSSQEGKAGEQHERARSVVRGPGPAYPAWVPVPWVEAGWSRREECTGTRLCQGHRGSQNVKKKKKAFKQTLAALPLQLRGGSP